MIAGKSLRLADDTKLLIMQVAKRLSILSGSSGHSPDEALREVLSTIVMPELKRRQAAVVQPKKEIWRTIKGAGEYGCNYEISSYGRIRSKRYDKDVIKTGWGKRYRRIKLYNAKLSPSHIDRPIHVLVAETFVGTRPGIKFDVHHRDGNTHNNYQGNLEWSCQSKNRQGPNRSGHLNGRAKLSPEQVLEIRRRSRKGESNEILARRFSVAKYVIEGVVTCRTYCNVK